MNVQVLARNPNASVLRVSKSFVGSPAKINPAMIRIAFWPNFIIRKGTVANIAFWCRARS